VSESWVSELDDVSAAYVTILIKLKREGVSCDNFHDGGTFSCMRNSVPGLSVSFNLSCDCKVIQSPPSTRCSVVLVAAFIVLISLCLAETQSK